jgi:hypothetical protein
MSEDFAMGDRRMPKRQTASTIGDNALGNRTNPIQSRTGRSDSGTVARSLGPDEDEKATDILLDYTEYSYSAEADLFDKLDTKASTLSGFTSIMIALSANALVGVFTRTATSDESAILGLVMLSLCRLLLVALMISLCLSLVCFIRTLRLRHVRRIPTSQKALKRFLEGPPELTGKPRRLKKYLVNSVSAAEGSFREINMIKFEYMRKGTACLLCSLGCTLGATVTYLLYAVCSKT